MSNGEPCTVYYIGGMEVLKKVLSIGKREGEAKV